MLAVDTNVIVRYLTRDDAAQFARASALIRAEEVYVCSTVLLETEWVLRRSYGYTRDRIFAALGAFAGLPRVTLEAPVAVATALRWLADGMDFADALHLAGSQHCEAFVSFDRRLVSRARRMDQLIVRTP